MEFWPPEITIELKMPKGRLFLVPANTAYMQDNYERAEKTQ